MALKLGTENKTKTYAAIGLTIVTLIVAAHFIYDQFFSSPAPPPVMRTPPPAVARTITRPSAEGSPATAASAGSNALNFAHTAITLPSASALDPTLHPEIMAQAEATTYTGDGRNIFSANSAPVAPVHIEQVKASIRQQATVPTGPPPPPPPPDIDLKYFGYYGPKGGPRRVCLSHGEDLFLASEGDVVDRRYKVVKITTTSVDVEDMAYNHTQTLPLVQN